MMAVATLQMKRVTPAVARVLSGRVARTDSEETHARRATEHVLATVASSQNAQLAALGILADARRDRSARDELSRALTKVWFVEHGTDEMCDHYARIFNTQAGGVCLAGAGYAIGWQEARDGIFREMNIRSANKLLIYAHERGNMTDFETAKRNALEEMHTVFGEELGWLLLNCGVRNDLVRWIHEADFRFDWDTLVHPGRFTEHVFGVMMREAPWRKNVRLNRIQLLRQDVGAMLLAHIAPCTLDPIEEWLRPGVRQPRGLKKVELRRMWEQMIIELRATNRYKPGERSRMVDPDV